LFREFVAGPWHCACYDRCKPSTQRVMRSALERQLLPAFGAVRLDRISRIMVVRWFDAYSATAPGGANRVLDILRQILNQAVACGHIATNPARSIRRNRRAKLTRFLSREEIRRLHRVLDCHAERSESARQQADIIRLLLLTGCRKSEIVRLRWQEVDGDRLNLADSKTGPRRVYLNAWAQDIIERRMAQAESQWVFPSARGLSHPRGDELALWYTVRREAGIAGVRLHDLRHTVATHAVMHDVPLPVVARLLGHRRPSMTLRYTHVGDSDIEAAADRVGQTIARLMAGVTTTK
ncbi:MAG: tyrosine-type recombinase/integrase, partial [Thiotrichales bacterium]|nr:tyrosine-type recombinase/integrase [Thiotrichales bacterium]